MARLTLQEFLLNRNLLAMKISSSELGGLFSKRLTVPLGTTGLALFSDGALSLFQEGQEVSGKFDLVLAKSGDVTLRMMYPDLTSSDGFPVTASAALVVSIQTHRPDLYKDFVKSLFHFPGSFSTTELKNFINPELHKNLREIVAGARAEELQRSGDVSAKIAPTLERHLFGTGVRFEKMLEAGFASPEYEKVAAAEAKRKEESRLSSEKQDKKEARVRRLATMLKDEQIQSALGKIPDEKMKSLVIAKLMEDDSLPLSAEDLINNAPGAGEEVVRMIYRTMEALLANGESVGADEIETENADRIFVATGHKILDIDPAKDDHRSYDLRESLRSVRAVGGRLMAGSKKAIHLVDGGQVMDFPLPGDKSPRGGVNSIAAGGPFLFATHSEFGLARWKAEKPGEAAEIIHAELTSPNKTTRAVQVIGDRLVFASGMHVYVTAVENGAAPTKFVSSVESPITCVTVSAKSVFAGTESGAIVGWKIDLPDQPVVVARKKETIVNLRLAKVSGIPHLFYSCKDLSIRARVVGQNLEKSYESGGSAVGVLDAASDYVCASDAAGRKLLLWRAAQPTKAPREIDTWKYCEKPILDLWMRKTPTKVI